MQEDAFKYMLQKEKAGSFGILGERLEKALAALRAFDAAHPKVEGAARDERAALVKAASERLFSYIVTREAAGVTHHDSALAHYGVPDEVRLRMGAS